MTTGMTIRPKWRHLKTGHIYRIIDLCIIEASMKWGVLYRRNEVDPADCKSDRLWMRPLDEFFDGRFEPYEDKQP